MIFQATIYSPISLECLLNISFVLMFLGICYYLYKNRIYKECVFFLFKKARYGNICLIERSLLMNSQTHVIESVDKEVLNVTNRPEDPKITIYISDDKFYELFFLYGERGLGEAFSNKYFTTDLLELFEIIHGIKSYEWTLHKCFSDSMDFKKTYEIDYKIRDANKEEYVFFAEEIEIENEARIIIHNGLFDFNNTFISLFHPNQFITVDGDLNIERMERNAWIPELEDEMDEKTFYYASFVKFLFKKKYLSYNHLFCKK